MEQPSGSDTASTLLSAALVPRVPSDQFTVDEDDEVFNRCRERIAQILAEVGAKELEIGGDELIVVVDDPTSALSCAVKMQDIVDRAMRDVMPSSQCVLDVGIHHTSTEGGDEWLSGSGFRVVSALRRMANGEITVSADLRSAVTGAPRVRFLERGDMLIDGEPRAVKVFSVVSLGGVAELFGSLAWAIDQLSSKAGYIAIPVAAIALALYVYSREDGFIDGVLGNLWPAAPIESIAILPFEGDPHGLRSEPYRDELQNRVRGALMAYENLRVIERVAPPAAGAAATETTGTGDSGQVEATLSGEARTAGEWLLVRAHVDRTSDGAELWSGSYYKRISEIETISEQLVSELARSLGLDLAEAPDEARGLARSMLQPASPGGGAANLESVRDDLEDALQQAQRLDLDAPSRITSLNNLASLYYDSGRDAEAIPIYQEVIKMRETSLGPDHPEVAVSLNNLASLYVARGRYADAEPLYRRSLNIRLAALGPKHPRVANAMNNLALLYHREGRLAEAEALYADALEIRKHELELELGPESAQLNDRAARFQLEGNYTAAAKTYERALEVEAARSGEDNVRTASLTQNLAVAKGLEGDVEEAESLLQRAISLFTGSLGENHERTARSMADLGELYRRTGRLSEAEQYHERALEAYESSLGVDHPEVAGTLGYLVSIFELQGREEKASEARERKQAIRQTYLGPVFSYVAARAAEQSVIRDRQQDELTAPQPLHEYQLQVDEGELVSEKRRFAENLHNMALLYLDLGRFKEAEKFCLDALSIRRSIGGGHNPEVAISLHALARINTGQERYSDARVRYKEALQIFESTLGRVHPHIARCWSDLAELLRKLDLTSEAVYAADRARQTNAALAGE